MEGLVRSCLTPPFASMLTDGERHTVDVAMKLMSFFALLLLMACSSMETTSTVPPGGHNFGDFSRARTTGLSYECTSDTCECDMTAGPGSTRTCDGFLAECERRGTPKFECGLTGAKTCVCSIIEMH
jgi:hypothetical protein